MNSSSPETILAATSSVRRLLSKDASPPVNPVLAAGAGPILVKLLEHSDAKIVFEAAWCITNIASTSMTSKVIEMGALPAMVKLLRSSHENVREQVIWCLGNIVGDGPELRDMVLDTPDCAAALVLNIQHPASISLLRNATWTISNFCRGKPKADASKIGGLVGILVSLLSSTDKDVLADALWGISYLTDGSEHFARALVETEGALGKVVECSRHERSSVVIPALRTIGNVVSGSDDLTEAAIAAGCLDPMPVLLLHEKRNIRREACWAVSNIAAGTKDQIAKLVHTPGLIASVHKQASQAEWFVRKEAAWVISNAANSARAKDIEFMVHNGAFTAIVSLLNTKDPKFCGLMLDAMFDILKAGDLLGLTERWTELFDEAGGGELLEELQDHDSKQVYDSCIKLVSAYFSDAEDDAEENSSCTAIVPAAATPNPFGTSFAANAASVPAKDANPFAASSAAGFPGAAPAFTFGAVHFG
jgi:importin subunit alpha-6/7